MSKENLMARLAALKNTSKEVTSPAQDTPKEVSTGQAATIQERMAALTKQTNDKVTEQVTNAEEGKPEVEQLSAAKIKLLVSEVDSLKLSFDTKVIPGFEPAKFEENLNQINIVTEDNFPEIKMALIEINKDLRNFPELAHMLNKEQVRVIVRRILHSKHEFIAPVKAAKKPAKPKVSSDVAALLASISSDVDNVDASDL